MSYDKNKLFDGLDFINKTIATYKTTDDLDDIGFKDSVSNPIRNMKKKTMRQLMFPIFSGISDAYQMDTLFNMAGNPPYFLVMINVNSRKGYAYPMYGKGTNEVYPAYQTFLDDVKKVRVLTTDEDPAYKSNAMLYLYSVYNTKHITTNKNNHNKLGIINRFIKTLRDLNRVPLFTEQRMNKCLEVYNNHVHRSTGKSPNKFTYKDEHDYIKKKWRETNYIRSAGLLKRGDHVRVLDEALFAKKRFAYRPEYLTVVGIDKNMVQVMSKNKNIESFPRYKLMLDNDSKIPQQEYINNGNEAAIDKILNHDERGRYLVRFEDGDEQWIPLRNVRLTNLQEMTPKEKEYWDSLKKNTKQDVKQSKIQSRRRHRIKIKRETNKHSKRHRNIKIKSEKSIYVQGKRKKTYLVKKEH